MNPTKQSGTDETDAIYLTTIALASRKSGMMKVCNQSIRTAVQRADWIDRSRIWNPTGCRSSCFTPIALPQDSPNLERDIGVYRNQSIQPNPILKIRTSFQRNQYNQSINQSIHIHISSRISSYHLEHVISHPIPSI